MANMHQRPVALRRCTYANRGCTTTVRGAALSLHLEECGFAPVQCSHDGCEVTVNKQDLVSHQQNCGFRSLTCEECHVAMKQRDYALHSCVVQRVLSRILQGDQQSASQLAIPQAQQGAGILQFETTQVQQVVTRRLAARMTAQDNSAPGPQANHLQPAAPSISTDHFRAACSLSTRTQHQPPVEGEIVVTGGRGKSYEIFNWFTQQWTLFEDALFFDHTNGFSFLYDNKVMFCGGARTDRVEYLDIANYRTVCTFPAQLPGKTRGKGVLCGNEIFTFGESVSKTSLQNPFGSRVLRRYEDERKFSNYGIARVNDNTVVLVGGNNSYTRVKYDGRGKQYNVSEVKEYTDNVTLYDPSRGVVKTLAPLPYGLSDMAVVAHGENVIILGGKKAFWKASNEVLMYNITKQECSRLPSMLEKRSNFAAVIKENTIVVFGGNSLKERDLCLDFDPPNTVEYLVLGDNTWKNLPPMHYKRNGSTACVLP